MRLVGGQWAGTDLVSPGSRVRPTRETVRAAWLSELGPFLAGARVLDLFAGTGALGLEALSRGAATVDFVENGAAALHALKANIVRLRVKDRTRLFKKDVFLFLRSVEEGIPPGPRVDRRAAPVHPRVGPDESSRDQALHRRSDAPVPYRLVLADPPYTGDAAEHLVSLWLKRPFSQILSVEHAAHRKLPGMGRRRTFQDTSVTTYRIPD